MPMPEMPAIDQARNRQDREVERINPAVYLHVMPRNAGQVVYLYEENPTSTTLSEFLPGFFEEAKDALGVKYASSEHVLGKMFDHSQDVYLHAVSKNVGPIDTQRPLAVMSGVCLWGVGEVFGITAQEDRADLRRELLDRRMPPVEIDTLKGQHPYGLEATARLTRTIASLRQYAEQFGRGMDPPVRMHLPNAEYKFPMVAVYQQGKVSKDFLEKYFDVVDAKYAEMRDRIDTEFGYYDMPAPQYFSPLTEQVDAANLAEIPQKLTILATQFETAESQASYIAGLKEFSAERADTLPIVVDTISERSYFDEASKSDAFRGVGLYPLPLYLKGDRNLPMRRTTEILYSEQVRCVLPWRYGRIN